MPLNDSFVLSDILTEIDAILLKWQTKNSGIRNIKAVFRAYQYLKHLHWGGKIKNGSIPHDSPLFPYFKEGEKFYYAAQKNDETKLVKIIQVCAKGRQDNLNENTEEIDANFFCNWLHAPNSSVGLKVILNILERLRNPSQNTELKNKVNTLTMLLSHPSFLSYPFFGVGEAAGIKEMKKVLEIIQDEEFIMMEFKRIAKKREDAIGDPNFFNKLKRTFFSLAPNSHPLYVKIINENVGIDGIITYLEEQERSQNNSQEKVESP